MTVDTEFNSQQRECIDELKKRMKGRMEAELYEDKYLFYRFLKARDFNLNNAEAMLRKHLEWREKYDVKNIQNFKRPEVVKYFPNVIIGEGKECCPVRYCPAGSLDFTGLNASCKFEDLVLYMISETEIETRALQSQSKKLGRNIDKIVYVHNFANLSFVQATDKKNIYSLIYLLNLFQNNYPERLKVAYAINASIYFSFIFNAMKPFLAKTILNKIHVYSDDSYKEDLLKIIDADVLPAFLGGTRTDPDGNPMCLSLIPPAGPVPESYYIHRSKKSLAKSPGVKKLTLPRAAFYEVFLEVKEPGSYLEWEFETKCRDIGFGLFQHQETSGQEGNVELIPIQRIDTDEYAEAGMFQCQDAGPYVLVFDNTYSWIRSKEIFYRIKVLTPKEYEAQVNN